MLLKNADTDGKPLTSYEKALKKIEDVKAKECETLRKKWSDNENSTRRRRCPNCSHASAPKQRNAKRTIITSIGEVTYTRHAYHCPRCQTAFCPADTTVEKDLGYSSMTRDLTELALDFALNDPYEVAAERFELHHGVKISRSGYQRIVAYADEKLAQKKTTSSNR